MQADQAELRGLNDKMHTEVTESREQRISDALKPNDLKIWYACKHIGETVVNWPQHNFNILEPVDSDSEEDDNSKKKPQDDQLSLVEFPRTFDYSASVITHAKHFKWFNVYHILLDCL